MRKTFAVGKLTGRSAEILLVESADPPVSGPWLLRALVRSRPPTSEGPVSLPGISTVH